MVRSVSEFFPPEAVSSVDWANVANKQEATPTTAGLMSAADKVKLNNTPKITASLTPPENPAWGDVWIDMST